MLFNLHVGIDYSGRETPTSRTPALQVYAGFDKEQPRRIQSPAASRETFKNWNRQEIAEWLIEQTQKKISLIAGVDHGFSFPFDYFQRYELTSWPEFLDDFSEHWPTDAEHTYVDFIREGRAGRPVEPGRTLLGEADERGFLDRYFRPRLTAEEQTAAELEGWILGVM